MPMITVELMPGRTEAQKDAFSKRVVQAMCEEMGTKPEGIWVIYREVQPEDWYMGEKSIAQVRREREAK